MTCFVSQHHIIPIIESNNRLKFKVTNFELIKNAVKLLHQIKSMIYIFILILLIIFGYPSEIYSFYVQFY